MNKTRQILPKLILHFDVNGTIMVADPAGGLSLTQALDKCRFQPDWTDSAHCHRLQTALTSRATLEESLLWNCRENRDQKSLTVTVTETETERPDHRLSHDGKYHFLLPSFFKAITELIKRDRDFVIVLRTFGTDITDVLAALEVQTYPINPTTLITLLYIYLQTRRLLILDNTNDSY